jgi:predicted ester cyclase
MSSPQNKDVALGWFSILNAHELHRAEGLFSPDYVLTMGSEEHRGPNSIIAVVSSFYEAFPDLRFTTEDVLAEGEHVLVRWRVQGTHRGPLQGVAPTGRHVTWTGMSLLRIREGQVVEDRVEMDALGLMQQLGAVPAPA